MGLIFSSASRESRSTEENPQKIAVVASAKFSCILQIRLTLISR